MQKNKISIITNGIAWSTLERFSVQGIQFVVQIILARLLAPSDFGLIAIVLVLMNIFQTINESGFLVALVQKIDRNDADFSTVFFFNLLFGFFMYGILYCISPYISTFFNQPQLTTIARIIGINLIISSFVIVQLAILMIRVDFKTQAKASFIAVVISGAVGIYCAYRDLGVMSLVYQSLLNNSLNVLFIWYYTKWKPNFIFSYSRFKKLFKFSYKLVLARLLDVIYNDLFSVVIGKFYNSEQLGYYNRARSFQLISSKNITDIVQRVSTPLLCESQNDHIQLRSYLKQFMVFTSIIVFPIMVIFMVLAEPIISVVLSEKWIPATYMLQLLCPVGMLNVINTFNRNVYSAVGRPGLALKLEVYKKTMMIALLIFSIPFGLKVILISQIISAIIELVFNTYFTKRLIDFGFKKQLRSISGVILSSIFMAIVILITNHYVINNIYKLIVGISLGSGFYLSLCIIFNIGNLKLYLYNMIKK